MTIYLRAAGVIVALQCVAVGAFIASIARELHREWSRDRRNEIELRQMMRDAMEKDELGPRRRRTDREGS